MLVNIRKFKPASMQELVKLTIQNNLKPRDGQKDNFYGIFVKLPFLI